MRRTLTILAFLTVACAFVLAAAINHFLETT